MRPVETPRRGQRRFLWVLALWVALLVGCRHDQPIEKSRLTRLPPTHNPGSVIIAEDGRSYAFLVTTPEGERIVTPTSTSPPRTAYAGLAFAPKSHRLLGWTLEVADDRRLISIVAEGTSIPTDAVAAGGLTFSADGSRWAGIGVGPGPVEGEVGHFTLFMDGRSAGQYRDVSVPAFSPDGRHTAYLFARDNRVTLLVDGVEQQTFDAPVTPCGSAAVQAARRPDLSTHHVVRYLADGSLFLMTRDADGWGVYRDGVRLASYPLSLSDGVPDACRSAAMVDPSSLRHAEKAPVTFWWERVAGDTERWRVSRQGLPLDDTICSQPWQAQPPEVSPDGTHVAYACSLRDAHDLTTVFLVKDGQRYGPYQEIWGIALSPDGAHVTYGATLAGTPGPRPWAIYVDGKLRAKGFAAVWRPRISEDGATLVWQAKRSQNGRGILGINDREVGTFDDVLWGPEPEPDPRGERVAWVIRRGRSITRVSVPLRIADKPRRPRDPRG